VLFLGLQYLYAVDESYRLWAMTTQDPFALLEKRRQRRDEERLHLRKRLSELDAEAADDATALRVLKKAYEKEDEAPEPRTLPKAIHTVGATPGLFFTPDADRPIKDLILAVLADAAPNGMTAAQIRDKAMLKYRRLINPNTLTVSLVRASKQRGTEPPVVRCQGRVWYYLPPTITPNPEPPQQGAGVFG
jgi:hypothetical protein